MRIHPFARLWAPLGIVAVMAAIAVLAAPVSSQAAPGPGAATGILTGRIADATTGLALEGVAVEVRGIGAAARQTQTDAAGRFRVTDLPSGAYEVVAIRLGYAEARLADVRVEAGSAVSVVLRMAPEAVYHERVTVSVGRKPEVILRAPASVAVVGAKDISERPALSPVDHLRSVPGVDLITYGLQSSNIVTRGFNNLFSGALYTLTDYRIASVPSLRVNLMHLEPITNEDMESMEVVLGPGAALYGPNTANGVLHILTRSPLRYQGTQVSYTTGERDVSQAVFRSAHKLGDDFAFKLSGQFASGSEWEFIDPVEAIARDRAIADPAGCRGAWAAGGVPADEAALRCSRVGERGYGIERFSFDARADWRMTDAWTAVASGGMTQANGIELTGLGAAQARDWSKYYGQLRTSRGRFFGQVYLNGSDAGRTYLLQNGASIVDRSKLLVGQLQHGLSMGERQDFTYGVDYLRTMPETEGTINGANEADDLMTEVGAYLQSETALAPMLDLVLAGRVDKHSALEDPVFSPRAALVFKPGERHNLRATFNSAFETPSSLNLFLDIHGGAAPDPTLAALGYGLRAQGPGTAGIDLVGAGGLPLGMRSPFNPAGAGQLLPTDPAALWAIAVGVMRAQGAIDDQTAADFLALDASALGINAIDPNTRQLTSLAEAGMSDVPAIAESRTTTLELGYKGLLAGDRVALAVDVWHTRKSDFVSPLFGQTPFLLVDGATTVQMLVPYYMGQGLTQEQATAQALGLVQGDAGMVGIATIPLAVASAPGVNAVGADMLVSYRNFGEVTLWGADVTADITLGRGWRMGLSGSYTSDDHFRIPLEGVEQVVALNAPSLKGSTSLGFRDAATGFNAEGRVRYHNEFPANSAGYAGLACVGVEGSPACVEDAVLADVTLGYRLPMASGAMVQLTVQNLFDTPYRSFVRVPAIGRLALLRLSWAF